MGNLDEGHFNAKRESRVNLGECTELGLEEGEHEISAIKDAVRLLLEGLSEDINREGILKTPLRVAKALREGTRGYRENANDLIHSALFPEDGLDSVIGHAGGAGGVVIVRDLDLFSYCESCLLPFHVKCHVGYIPSGQKVVGLSKLSRVADVFAKRLQNPQRLANEVCEALQLGIEPAGVAVLLQCSHIHFPNLEPAFLDSNHEGWIKLLVTSGSGAFEAEHTDVWQDFLSLLRFRGINVTNVQVNGAAADRFWCPSHSLTETAKPASPAMMNAVVSIIQSLGEDPSRKEIAGTPARFVTWLMKFKNCNFDMKLNGFVPNGREPMRPNRGDEQFCSELNLSFWSQCEHHLFPFHGVVHIGYYCDGGVNQIGRSLLQSIVHSFGFKLQVQERLTRQIAETASSLLGTEDVMVVVEASHTCMVSRGIEKFGSSTATIAVLGRFSTDSTARTKFLLSIPNACQFGL